MTTFADGSAATATSTPGRATLSSGDRKSLGYLPQLDGLRGITVVLVMIHHAWTVFGGWVGVDVFFVLSGYLITTLLKQERDRAGSIDLRRFYLRRLLRLYPPLLLVLVVVFPIGVLGAPSVGVYLEQNLVAGTYLTNIFGLISGQHVGPWSQTWTLAVEEQFYLVWPALFILAFAGRGRVRVVVLALIGAASVALAAHPPFSGDPHFNPVLTSGGLVLGCSLALTRPQWERVAGRLSVAIAGVVGLIAGVAAASSPTTTAVAEPLAVLGSLALVAHLTTSASVVSWVLSTRPLVFVGKISYELYLWHFALFFAAFSAWPGHFRITILAAYGAAFVASVMSRRFLSEPLNRRFKARLSGTTVVPTVSVRVPEPEVART